MCHKSIALKKEFDLRISHPHENGDPENIK